MIYLKYVSLVLLSLPMNILALMLAPVLPLLSANAYGWSDNHSREDFGPRLPTWLSWFQTPDNDLYGDSTFVSLNGKSYWTMVKWLLRNPLYAFGVIYLTPEYRTAYIGDPSIKDNDNAKAGYCFVTANGLFQFRYIKRIPFTARCVLVNLGWNIMAMVDSGVYPKPDPYQATFVFSPRISGFR